MHTVAVSILNYNNSHDTIDCLDSLLQLELGEYQLKVFVLDNGSKEKFETDTKRYKKINLKVLRLNDNSGFTGGHNYLYKKAKEEGFDYFMILNNDCTLDPKCLVYLIGKLKGNTGAVVPKIYFTKGREYHKDRYKEEELGKVIWYAGGEIDWNNVASHHIGLDEVDHGQYDTESEIEFATGACVLFTKDLVEKTGLFDNKYFLYYEDADLSIRIKKAGYKILYAPNAVVWHNNAGSSGSGSNLHDYYLTRNKLLFGMQHAGFKMKLFLLKEAINLLKSGRPWQKRGVLDFFAGRLGKGSFYG